MVYNLHFLRWMNGKSDEENSGNDHFMFFFWANFKILHRKFKMNTCFVLPYIRYYQMEFCFYNCR